MNIQKEKQNEKDAILLKIVFWAQRHRKKVEKLTKEDIIEAIRSKS